MAEKKKKEPEFYLGHIIQAADDIAEYMGGCDKKSFFDDKKTHDATIRQLMIIGEATKNLPQTFRRKYPEIPWKKIAGTRDRLVHEYFGVDMGLAWIMAKNDVPNLKEKIALIMRSDYDVRQKKLLK
jgi:uncharacterized protein with HEPN domain